MRLLQPSDFTVRTVQALGTGSRAAAELADAFQANADAYEAWDAQRRANIDACMKAVPNATGSVRGWPYR